MPKGIKGTTGYLDSVFDNYKQEGAILVPITETSQEINDDVTQEVDNILGHDERLFDTFMNIIKHGGAELSENIGNDFEKETELKVCKIDKSEVLRLLELHEFKKIYDGYIHDVYLDSILDPKKMLDKRGVTVRIRFKIFEKDGQTYIKVLCTLKKRIPKEKYQVETSERGKIISLREVFEKEFKINNLGYVFHQFESLDLYPYRQKQKHRIEYATRLHGSKFAVDDYDGIDDFMEIESKLTLRKIMDFMNTLQVSHLDTSAAGSRKFFKLNGKEYDYIHKGKGYKDGIYIGGAKI